MGETVKPKSTPTTRSRLLSRHTDLIEFDKYFDNRSVVGKLDYLEKGCRSDIT